jgi:hypothetical protein
MNDDLILKLVNELDGRREIPVAEKEGYSYFETLVEFSDKPYRLVLLLEDVQFILVLLMLIEQRERGD